MKQVKIVAESIWPDEPCWGLYEGPAMLPQPDGSIEDRWVQDVTVIRGDRKAHHVTDMGDPEQYRYVTPMMMPSFGENTVAQLQEFADKNREDHYWQKRAAEMLDGSTLIEDHIRLIEQSRALIRNRTTIGSGVFVQRGGYSKAATERKFKERRQAFHRRSQV